MIMKKLICWFLKSLDTRLDMRVDVLANKVLCKVSILVFQYFSILVARYNS